MRHTRLVSVALCASAALLLGGLARSGALRADDAPFPAGESTQDLHGLKVTLEMPKAFDASAEHSLVVVLHGLGGTADGMGRALQFLNEKDYVIAAPKSVGQGWEKSDLDAVKEIVKELKAKVKVGAGRLHGVGFSNGGWNLHTMVFDPDLGFATGAWVAAGCREGSPEKSARKTFGAIAFAGSEDPNRSAAQATVGYLEDKVKSVEFHEQAGIGHEWPRELMPYFGWWLDVQEGRFTPGACRAFEWDDPVRLTQVVEGGTGVKAGAFAYVYDAAAVDDAAAKELENDLFRDPSVQFFGRQLVALMAQRDVLDGALAAAKVKSVPAVVVFDASGKVKNVLTAPFKAKSLASALKAVAPEKKQPK